MKLIDENEVSKAVEPNEASPARVPGEPGVWILLFGDMLVFAVFFVLFMYQRAQAPELFDVSRHTLNVGIGLANTVILLTSSLLVVTAIRAVCALDTLLNKLFEHRPILKCCRLTFERAFPGFPLL